MPHILAYLLSLPLLLPAREVPKITVSDYLPAQQNWAITQGCDDNLYVANSAGVLIFNGYQRQTVTLPARQIARSVYRGADCKIYVGGYESFGYIDTENPARPRYVPLADSLLRGGNQEIWQIFGTEKQLFFQSFSQLFSLADDRITDIPLPANIMFGSVIDARIVIPAVEGGIFTFDRKISEIYRAGQLPSDVKISAVTAADRPGEIIIGTQNSGLYRTENGNITPLPSPLHTRLRDEQINKILRLRNGNYAVGTILNGIYITPDFQTVTYHINKLNGLTNNTVLSLFEDRTGNLWVGTDKGLNRFSLQNPLEFYYDKQGKLGTVYTYAEHEEKLYLGTNQGVFAAGENEDFSLIKNSQGQVWSFLKVGDDLLCGHNTGTFLIENGTFKRISDNAGGWAMRKIDARRVLSATYSGLFLSEKNADGNWTETRCTDGEITVKDFVLRDNLLIGHHPNRGIILAEFSADFTRVLRRKIIRNFNGTDFFDDLQILSEGLVIKNDTIYQVENFALHTVPQNALPSPENPEMQYFRTAKTLRTSENIRLPVTFPTVADAQDFIFGFDEGYLRVPAAYAPTAGAIAFPQVDYLLQGNRFFCANADEETEFSPQENDLTVAFRNAALTENGVENFTYRLRGWDKKAYPFPADGILKFLNLRTGNYTLILSNVENGAEREVLQFSVQPHWYESWQGGLLYFSLIIGLIYALNLRSKSKLRRQAAALKIKQERQLESERIRAKNEQLERELLYKSKMLANSTMTLIQKNKMLAELKEMIDSGNLPKQKMHNLIDRNVNSDSDWEVFERNFAAVHKDFFETLKNRHPEVTAGELRLAAYIKLNLSSKEIAPLLGISVRSVENKRYRLRKRLEITKSDSLKNYLMRL